MVSALRSALGECDQIHVFEKVGDGVDVPKMTRIWVLAHSNLIKSAFDVNKFLHNKSEITAKIRKIFFETGHKIIILLC